MNQTASYPAKVSSPQIGPEAVEGFLQCLPYELKFLSDSYEFSFPWKELVLTTTGNEEDQVFFSHPSAPEWTLYTEDAEILEEPIFRKLTHLRRQVQKYRQKQGLNRYLKVTLLCLVFFLGIALFLSWFSTKLMEWAALSISLETEMKWGEEMLAQMREEGARIETNQVSSQLTVYANQLFPVRGTSQGKFMNGI